MDGRGQRCERTRSWIGTVCDHANYDDIRDDGACMGDALHDALDNSFHGFCPPLCCAYPNCLKPIDVPENNLELYCPLKALCCRMSYYCCEEHRTAHALEHKRNCVSKNGKTYVDVLSYYASVIGQIIRVEEYVYNADIGLFIFHLYRGHVCIRQLPISTPFKRIGECRYEAMKRFVCLLRENGYHPNECKLGLFQFECTSTGKGPPNYHMAVLYIKKGIWYYEATSGPGMGYWHGPLHVRLNLPAQPVKRWQVASYTFKKLGWESDHVRRYLDDDRICPMVVDTSHCLTTRYILHT